MHHTGKKESKKEKKKEKINKVPKNDFKVIRTRTLQIC